MVRSEYPDVSLPVTIDDLLIGKVETIVPTGTKYDGLGSDRVYESLGAGRFASMMRGD